MRRWQKKAAYDAIKAFVPFKDGLRAKLRSIRPYKTDPDNDALLSSQAQELVKLALLYGGSLEGKRVLEFGSGWNPILPKAFRKAGAGKITLTDQEKLLSVALLQELDCSYLVPFNPLEVKTGSVDIIVSRAVLEHVIEKDICPLFQQFRRILKSGGLMLHMIDMSDHWEHNDKSISRVNFLQFEDDDWFWKLANLNPQNVQNRFRLSDFVEKIKASGFRVIHVDGEPAPSSLDALKEMRVAKRFQDKTRDDLATITATIVAM